MEMYWSNGKTRWMVGSLAAASQPAMGNERIKFGMEWLWSNSFYCSMYRFIDFFWIFSFSFFYSEYFSILIWLINLNTSFLMIAEHMVYDDDDVNICWSSGNGLLRVVCWRLLKVEGSESNAHPVTLRSVTQTSVWLRDEMESQSGGKESVECKTYRKGNSWMWADPPPLVNLRFHEVLKVSQSQNGSAA